MTRRTSNPPHSWDLIMEKNNFNKINKLAALNTAFQLTNQVNYNIRNNNHQVPSPKWRTESKDTKFNKFSSLPHTTSATTRFITKPNESITFMGSGEFSTPKGIYPQSFTNTSVVPERTISYRGVRRAFGLSGAGAKWYLRYVQEGFSPEEAKQKVLERTSNTIKRGAHVNYSTYGNPAKKSREDAKTQPSPMHDVLKPALKSVALKVKTDPKLDALKTAFKDALKPTPGVKTPGIANGLRLAVAPKAYPAHTLSREDQGKIEQLLVSEMCKGWKSKLKFDGIHFRPGLILIDCVTEEAAEWLELTIPKLTGWEGMELTTYTEDKIFGLHMITVCLPRATGIETKDLLDLLITQNDGLHTHLWKVFSSKEIKNGKVLTIRIDRRSLEAIKANNCRMSYRFGSVPVHLNKGDENSKADIDNMHGAETRIDVAEIPANVAEKVDNEAVGSDAREQVNISSHKSEENDDEDTMIENLADSDASNRVSLSDIDDVLAVNEKK
ncbi:uncharacterized protein LOC119686329 [Teleopsis dalmanni]|uniref:uncharacterized protein LOC119686329 n=1 Tax=Teleopsis dalmanni TaxID=139649 RepID=UPI0018CE98E4|nr:uncharacterized protein LOC119686329 [Teleopsis dalmanni]